MARTYRVSIKCWQGIWSIGVSTEGIVDKVSIPIQHHTLSDANLSGLAADIPRLIYKMPEFEMGGLLATEVAGQLYLLSGLKFLSKLDLMAAQEKLAAMDIHLATKLEVEYA